MPVPQPAGAAGDEGLRSKSIRLARRVLDVVNRGDGEALREMLAEEVTLDTGRRVIRGRDAVVDWSNKMYDHLDRRYAIEEFHPGPAAESTVGVGTVDYIWREEGALGDSSPIALELEFAGGELRAIKIHDDPAAALKHLD